MKVVWQPMAEADLEHIFDDIAQDNPDAALELDEPSKAKVDNAVQNRKLYKAGRVRGTREIVVRPSYVMVYSIEAGALVVLHVLHIAQQWLPDKP